MAGFMKVLFRNLLEGPSTDPFPVGETFTPERLRGKAVIDPELCVGCGVCKNVCAGGAINISPKEDKSGYTISIYRNSCCLCASCRHFCPTGAMSISNDWHHAHEASQKYEQLEQHTINFEPCAHCGTLIRPLPEKLIRKLYKSNTEIDPERIRHLCPKCRQLEDARRIEKVADKDNSAALAEKGGKESVELSPSAPVKEKESVITEQTKQEQGNIHA